MKKTLILMMIAALAAAVPAAAAGQFTLVGGYALTTNAHIGGGVAFGLLLSLPIARGLSLELGASRLQVSTSDDPDGLSAGSVSLIPIEVGLRGRIPLGQKMALFAAAGAGITLPHFAFDAGLVKSWTDIGFSLEEKLDLSFSASARCGLEAALTPRLGLVLEAGYRFCRAKGSWAIRDAVGSESVSGTFTGLNLDSIVLGLGLAFSFGR
ncbi:MAG: outer membrane beta-barrel protein [Candidatus Aminicenantes bacterium]|nr:outer membrane beta-barrel protein [Candidatus Aminicenantes bacterium]